MPKIIKLEVDKAAILDYTKPMIKLSYFAKHDTFIPVSPNDAAQMLEFSRPTIEFEKGLWGYAPRVVMDIIQNLGKGESITFVK